MATDSPSTISDSPGRSASAAPPQALGPIRALAAKVVEVLRPFCVQIEVAGSIRRHRPMCGDIDVVLLPKHGPGIMLELEYAIKDLAGTGRVLRNGNVCKSILLRKSGVQCDVWIADHGTQDLITPLPCNWGALLLTYTGSVSHNIKVVNAAKERGWKWTPTRGLIIPHETDRHASPEIVSMDETMIFERLFGKFIEPADRF